MPVNGDTDILEIRTDEDTTVYGENLNSEVYIPTQESDSPETITNDIEFDEEEKDKLDFVYGVLSEIDETKLKLLASNIENATIGTESNVSTDTELEEIKARLDDLVFTDDKRDTEYNSIITALESAFAEDISEEEYLVPVNTTPIKERFYDILEDAYDETVIESVQTSFDESLTVSLNYDTVDDILETFDAKIANTIDEETVQVLNQIVYEGLYEPKDAKEIRTEIIINNLNETLSDVAKVNSAQELINTIVEKLYSPDLLAAKEGVMELLSGVLSDEDLTSVSTAFNTSIGTGMVNLDNYDSVMESFTSSISSISGMSGTIDISDSFENGGLYFDTTKSAQTLYFMPSSITAVSGYNSDGEETIVTGYSLSENVITIPGIQNYVSVIVEYTTTYLNYVTGYVTDQLSGQMISLSEAEEEIANKILDYTDARSLSVDEVDTVKLIFDEAVGGTMSLQNLDAKLARFENLSADILTADQITATKATIREATIDTLYVKTLNAVVANIATANIDFANIDIGQIEQLFAKSGIIDNISTSSGTITGELVGVTIKGDLIEAGTLKADKLVILGSDGLYYKLNTEGASISEADVSQLSEDEQKMYRFDGSNILAQTVTADKITVSDLVAFGATIAGYTISDGAIRYLKETLKDSNTGVYIGVSGSGTSAKGVFGIGSSEGSHLFYDGDTLEISANSIIFTSGMNIETTITSVQDDVSTVQTDISTVKSDVSGVKSDVATVTSDVSTVKSDVSTVQSNVTNLENGTGYLSSLIGIDPISITYSSDTSHLVGTTVDPSTFYNTVGDAGSYTFTYDGSNWDISGDATISDVSTNDLSSVYGIELPIEESELTANDTFTIVYSDTTAGGEISNISTTQEELKSDYENTKSVVSNHSESISSLNGLKQDVSENTSNISSLQTNVKSNKDSIAIYEKYIKIDPSVPSIMLNSGESSAVLESDELDFNISGNTTAKLTSEELVANASTISTLNMRVQDPDTQEWTVGYVWLSRSNGHLSLKHN